MNTTSGMNTSTCLNLETNEQISDNCFLFCDYIRFGFTTFGLFIYELCVQIRQGCNRRYKNYREKRDKQLNKKTETNLDEIKSCEIKLQINTTTENENINLILQNNENNRQSPSNEFIIIDQKEIKNE